jgi:hypothetical protein
MKIDRFKPKGKEVWASQFDEKNASDYADVFTHKLVLNKKFADEPISYYAVKPTCTDIVLRIYDGDWLIYENFKLTEVLSNTQFNERYEKV